MRIAGLTFRVDSGAPLGPARRRLPGEEEEEEEEEEGRGGRTNSGNTPL